MYERFTDRARKVMQLAQQEAQRFNHEYIGTEHVLIGLLKEGSGVAANVLKNLDIDFGKLRAEVEKTSTPGPDMVTMGRLPHRLKVKHAIEASIKEAESLNHNYVGTEHMLLGLLADPTSPACLVLNQCGVTAEAVRAEVLSLLGTPKEMPEPKVEEVVNLTRFAYEVFRREGSLAERGRICSVLASMGDACESEAIRVAFKLAVQKIQEA